MNQGQSVFVLPPFVRAVLQRLFVFFVIAAVLLPQVGCTDSDYRKATRAAAGIATGLGALQDSDESLFKAQLLEKEEARAIAQGVIDATRLNDQLIATLRTMKTLDASNKQIVGALVGQVLTSLAALNEQGVLRVKNPDAKAKLSVIFAGIQSSIAIITQLMSENGIALPGQPAFTFSTSGVFTWPARSPAPPAAELITPAFDVDACARNLVTPDDVEFRRCPKRAQRDTPQREATPQHRATSRQQRIPLGLEAEETVGLPKGVESGGAVLGLSGGAL